MLRNLLFLVTLGLAVYSVMDVLRSTEKQRLGLPLGAWVLLVLVPIAGPVAWLMLSRSQGGGPGRSSSRRRPPVAPDDDPEFLSRLDEERRRREADGGGAPGHRPE